MSLSGPTCTSGPSRISPVQVLDAVRGARTAHLDGINFDLESPMKVHMNGCHYIT